MAVCSSRAIWPVRAPAWAPVVVPYTPPPPFRSHGWLAGWCLYCNPSCTAVCTLCGGTCLSVLYPSPVQPPCRPSAPRAVFRFLLPYCCESHLLLPVSGVGTLIMICRPFSVMHPSAHADKQHQRRCRRRLPAPNWRLPAKPGRAGFAVFCCRLACLRKAGSCTQIRGFLRGVSAQALSCRAAAGRPLERCSRGHRLGALCPSSLDILLS